MIGNPLVKLETVDSTNNYAKLQVQDGKAFHGVVYLAHHQTQGKGQRGKEWKAAPGENITLSILLKPLAQYLHHPFLCSMALAVGGYNFLKKYLPDELSIKWPNDIYWRNRKIGGILIENIYTGNQWNWAIGGIGININQAEFEELLYKAVSLRQIIGKQFDVIPLAKELCASIHNTWETWQQKGVDWLVNAYNEVLFCRNTTVYFKKENIQFEAEIIGADILGNLMLKHSIVEHFTYGEIEWML